VELREPKEIFRKLIIIITIIIKKVHSNLRRTILKHHIIAKMFGITISLKEMKMKL